MRYINLSTKKVFNSLMVLKSEKVVNDIVMIEKNECVSFLITTKQCELILNEQEFRNTVTLLKYLRLLNNMNINFNDLDFNYKELVSTLKEYEDLFNYSHNSKYYLANEDYEKMISYS